MPKIINDRFSALDVTPLQRHQMRRRVAKKIETVKRKLNFGKNPRHVAKQVREQAARGRDAATIAVMLEVPMSVVMREMKNL